MTVCGAVSPLVGHLVKKLSTINQFIILLHSVWELGLSRQWYSLCVLSRRWKNGKQLVWDRSRCWSGQVTWRGQRSSLWQSLGQLVYCKMVPSHDEGPHPGPGLKLSKKKNLAHEQIIVMCKENWACCFTFSPLERRRVSGSGLISDIRMWGHQWIPVSPSSVQAPSYELWPLCSQETLTSCHPNPGSTT